MLDILQDLLKDKRVVDAFALTRYMYRIGQPIVNDTFYGKLEDYCKDNREALPGISEFLNRTYDDDPVPVEVLQEFDLGKYAPAPNESRSEYIPYLDEEKSLSIEAITEYEDAYSYFMRLSDQDLIMSLKVDGINNKSLVLETEGGLSELKLTLSRGRRGKGYDFTDTILNIVPRYFKGFPSEVKIYSESYVESDTLPYLRQKYDPAAYKTEKSSAISMLRVKHDAEDYKHLKSLAFTAEGLSTKLSETLDVLQTSGFNTVPYIKIARGEVPIIYDKFVEWLKEKFDMMFNMSNGIPSDGIVVDVDDMTYSEVISNQYSNRNVALKMEYWSFNYYYATIKGILVEQQRVEASVRLQLEPLLAKDRTEARMLNGFNPDIIITEDLRPGQVAVFERNSGAINSIIRGARLKKLSLE
jgi:NAD-dependent DNA ligase